MVFVITVCINCDFLDQLIKCGKVFIAMASAGIHLPSYLNLLITSDFE